MPTLLRHATQKPPMGPLRLDILNTVAAGCVYDLVLNDNGNFKPNDVVGGNTVAFTGNALAYWGATCPEGPAIPIAGTSQYLSLGVPTALMFGGDHSVELLLKLTSNALQVLWQGYDNNSPYHGFGLAYNAAGTNKVDAWDGPDIAWKSISPAFTDANWHRIVATVKGSVFTGYFDSPANTTTITGNVPVVFTGNQFLGIYGDQSQFGMSGAIGRFRVWNRALSDGEAMQVLTEPYAVYQTRPLQKWGMLFAPSGAVATLPPGLGPEVGMIQPMMAPPW